MPLEHDAVQDGPDEQPGEREYVQGVQRLIHDVEPQGGDAAAEDLRSLDHNYRVEQYIGSTMSAWEAEDELIGLVAKHGYDVVKAALERINAKLGS